MYREYQKYQHGQSDHFLEWLTYRIGGYKRDVRQKKKKRLRH